VQIAVALVEVAQRADGSADVALHKGLLAQAEQAGAPALKKGPKPFGAEGAIAFKENFFNEHQGTFGNGEGDHHLLLLTLCRIRNSGKGKSCLLIGDFHLKGGVINQILLVTVFRQVSKFQGSRGPQFCIGKAAIADKAVAESK
jgi:hypothetical protein